MTLSRCFIGFRNIFFYVSAGMIPEKSQKEMIPLKFRIYDNLFTGMMYYPSLLTCLLFLIVRVKSNFRKHMMIARSYGTQEPDSAMQISNTCKNNNCERFILLVLRAKNIVYQYSALD